MSIATPPIKEAMGEWFRMILETDQVVEVRTVPPGKAIVLPADDLEGLVATAPRLKGFAGVYFTLNALDPSMLEADAPRYATDADVIRRRLILVDCDPKRPRDTSSTDDEKAEALAVAESVRDGLRAEGWPEPILADSSNGIHLLYRVDLAPEDQELVSRCLRAQASRFETATVKIDTSVSNPSRICKLYGTVSRKGKDTAERPHRRSRVLELPTSFDAVPGELLEALADSLIVPPRPPIDPPIKGGTRAYGETRTARYVTAALAGETEKMANAPDGERNNQLFKSSVALAELIGPDLSEDTVRQYMTDAAGAVQLTGREVPRTIESGIKKGLANPRRYPVEDRPGGDGHHLDGPARPKAKPSANGNGDGTAHVTGEAGDEEPEGDEGEVLDHWPKPQPLALHGLAGDIVKALAPHTEADPMAILIQLLVAFANMVGRRAHFSVGATQHFLNLFVALVGPTASGRKGSAWDMVSWALAQFDRFWATHRVQGGLVSGEGLIFHVRDAAYETRESKGKDGAISREQVMVDGGVEDKRLLVLETEMGRVLKAMSRESNTLSDVLRQAWDRNVLAAMGKNKGCIATGAHIRFVGHVTRPDICRHLTREDSSNGFANRFLWLAVRRSKELPDGGDLYSEEFAREWEPIKHRLEQTVAYASEVGRMQRDVDAGRMWRGVYGELTTGRPGLLGAVLNRAGLLPKT